MSHSDWTVQSATAADADAIRLLLPTVDGRLEEPAVLVAKLDGRVVAVGAVWCQTARLNPLAVPCDLHVAAPWRRQGIGRSMMTALEEAARPWGAQALCSIRPVRRESPTYAAWKWLGFADSTVMRSYEADVDALLGRHTELFDWCVATGRVPPQALTFRPGPEHAQEIARLNARSLGGMAWYMVDGFRAAAGTASDMSMAVADGDRLAGFILTRVTAPDTLHVHSHVIAPEFREGWAQAMLHHDFMTFVKQGGFRRFTFEAGDAHPVTRKTARRVGATLLAEHTLMLRPLTT